MADNLTTTTTVSTVPSGSVIATDDVAGVHFQKVKIDVGGDGASAVLGNSNPLPVSDAGGTLTVDNTVLSVVGGGVEATAQRVTIASDSTGVLSVDDNGGSLTVDGTVTANLAAGTNNIGDVDVLSVVPGTGASNLGKAEDAAHTSADVGVMALAVQQTADAALAGTTGDYAPLQVDETGYLKVNVKTGGTAGTQYVEDAAAAADPTGTVLNLVRKDALSATEVSADGDNIAARGSSAGAIYVELVSGTTKIAGTSDGLEVDVTRVTPGTNDTSLGKAEDAPHSSADVGVMALTVRQNTAASLSGTDGDYQPLITDTNGRLHVLDANSATALTALQLIDDTIFTDDAAFTPATSKVSVAGFQADETATDSVDEGDAGAARMTLDRKVIVQPQPHTAGGLSIFRSLDLDETEEDVKTSAGQVYGWFISNLATSTRFVKFYNATAANVTVGTTTPVLTFPIPGNSSDAVSANALGAMGIAFDTAICVAATTGVADNDTGAPAANDVVINIFYK